jgi:hypothetical protein
MVKLPSYWQGISLSTAYGKTHPTVFLSRLTLYIDEITGDRQCGFYRYRLTTDYIFCIYEI